MPSGVIGRGGGIGEGEGQRGEECPPKTSDREISDNQLGKERQGRKGKCSREEGKLKKGRWKIENGRRKSYKIRRRPFFFFFFFFTFQNH